MKSLFSPSSLALCLLLSGCVQYSEVSERRKTADLAATAEQRALVTSQARLKDKPLARIGRYLDAADAARVRLAANPTDVLAQSDYNFSVARVVEMVSNEHLAPWDRPLVCPSATGEPWQLGLVAPDPRPQFHPSKWKFTPADRFVFRGKLVGSKGTTTGLGAPVVAEGKGLAPAAGDVMGNGRDIFYGLTASLQFSGRRCEIVFADPLATDTLKFDRRTYTLAADFQAPIAMTLASVDVRRMQLKGLFKPEAFEDSARLSRTEPYDPKKIPVLLVHGLSNSPAIFAPVLGFLRNDPEIRRKYQFWVFGYPTGLPYPMAAAILRYDLDKMKRLYPDHKDIVVIGHSMGGMISRLLITDSGMKLWDAFFDRPPGEIPFSAGARNLMSRSLIFDARRDVSRVLFLAPSHRGSDMATGFWGRLGASLVGNPVSKTEINKEVYAFLRPEVRAEGRYRLPNSIELLDPNNRCVKTVATLPLKAGVPFHSLLGDRGRGGHLDHTKPTSNDGLVPYWSSHLPGARSEKIIPSGHWVQLDPAGMAEIKRILLENLR